MVKPLDYSLDKRSQVQGNYLKKHHRRLQSIAILTSSTSKADIMGFLTPLRSPQDVRWQGTARNHHITFFMKNVFLIFFIIIFFAEYATFRVQWNNRPDFQRDWDDS